MPVYPTRPLAISLPPMPGESFTSYINRLAYIHEVPLLTMLARTGVIDDEHAKSLGTGFGIVLPEQRIEAFACAARLERKQVEAMLLTAFNGIAIDMNAAAPENPESLRLLSLSEWAYFSGSHICPKCIEEDGGAWQLRWKLPWSFACARHNLLLADTCPRCYHRFGQGHRDRSTAPCFSSHVPTPSACMNALPKGLATPGRSSLPCLQPLIEVPTIDLSSWPDITNTQRTIDRILEGGPAFIAGEAVTPRCYFESLRSLAALLLYAATPEDLPQNPPVVIEALRAHAEHRDDRISLRAEADKATHTRVYVGPPRNTVLMAAITPLAVAILSASSRAELADELNWLVERTKARSRAYLWQIPEYFKFSECLTWAYSHCLEAKAGFDRKIGSRSVLGQTQHSDQYSFSPCHVPQLLWQDVYQDKFAALIPGVRENNARRFCAMALVKLCGKYTWQEAAMLLDLPANAADSMANRIVGILNVSGNIESFGQRLHMLATQVSNKANKTDYAELRNRLVKLTEIPDEDWRVICQQANISPGLPHSRQRYAAAWVWAEATNGDWALAPALENGNSQNMRDVYSRQFVKSTLPKVKTALEAYAKRLCTSL